MVIDLSNRQTVHPIDLQRLEAQARKILSALAKPEAELSVVLVDDAAIGRLNQDYLGRPGPTNVIAFPMGEGEFGQINPELLGDVVLSVETAWKEAAEAGYRLEEMLDFYLIHGILHLIGYDHEGQAEEAARMEAASQDVWRELYATS
jgi:probable rRNA maturation factor